MSSLSIRLDPETQRQARVLRSRGMIVSDVVRAAIREAYARTEAEHGRSRVAVIDRLRASYPASEDRAAARTYDVSSAREARIAVLTRLRRKRTG